MTGQVTRSVRGGYVVIFFGLMILSYGILSAYGVWKAMHADDPAKYKEVIETLSWTCAVSLLFGLVLIAAGWNLVTNVRGYDAPDPDEPMMKF